MIVFLHARNEVHRHIFFSSIPQSTANIPIAVIALLGSISLPLYGHILAAQSIVGHVFSCDVIDQYAD